MQYPLTLFNEESFTSYRLALVLILIFLILAIVFYHTFHFVEFIWVKNFSPKPFYRHLYFKKHRLTSDQFYILNTRFSFFQKLSPKQKKYFEHRVSRFIKLHVFEGRSGLYVKDEQKVLIASTAVMLTFGYRNYTINSLKRFIIYPDVFSSKINAALHKGEFNPALKTIVYSWKDFLEGYEIDNDNFNLGIHEIVHAIHHDFIHPNNDSISAILFVHYYNKIKTLMVTNTTYRERLIASKYIREYGFTNNFEFIAVVIESFFETPKEFQTQFPEMYDYVKKMLNFDFKGY